MKLLDFNKEFKDEASCEEYLRSEREKEGVICKSCGNTGQVWDKYNKCWRCKKCGHVTTLRSGTVMHASKLPLMYWFTAIHLLTSTKRTFSALEMQRQLGHKRYQPIWEMMHKIRNAMGMRDDKYTLKDGIELDEGYFTSENTNEEEKEKPLKRGVGSQRKSKVLVMVESQEAVPAKKSQKNRVVGHIKMVVVEQLTKDAIRTEAEKHVDKDAEILADAAGGHNSLKESFEKTTLKVVPGKDAPKVLPWVHIAISNAKSLFIDMYHGIKDEYLQNYLDEFCYKFNRKYFKDKLFDRLMICVISCQSKFEHRLYGTKPYKKMSVVCG